jgi:hypothetical protein
MYEYPIMDVGLTFLFSRGPRSAVRCMTLLDSDLKSDWHYQLLLVRTDHLLPLHRLTSSNRLAIGDVVAELRGQAIAFEWFAGVLKMVVQVGLARITAITTLAEQVPSLHLVTLFHLHTAAPQVREKGKLTVAMVNDNVIAKRLTSIHHSRHVVLDPIFN